MQLSSTPRESSKASLVCDLLHGGKKVCVVSAVCSLCASTFNGIMFITHRSNSCGQVPLSEFLSGDHSVRLQCSGATGPDASSKKQQSKKKLKKKMKKKSKSKASQGHDQQSSRSHGDGTSLLQVLQLAKAAQQAGIVGGGHILCLIKACQGSVSVPPTSQADANTRLLAAIVRGLPLAC